MNELAEQFERHREHLNRVAYRMLGSTGEAEDAVQEAWLRLSRSDAESVANLGGWLTTVVARVCLDLLRARRARREQSADVWLPEPVVVFRVRGGRAHPATARGPEAVASTILTRGAPFARLGRPALVNGAPGVLVGPLEAPISVVAFTVARGRIASVDVIASATIGH